jgi:hypothetical protein
MLKRTLIAITVVALLGCTAAQALGPDPHTGYDAGSKSGGIKVDRMDMRIYWPFEYKALDLCVIPVFMDVGVMVEVFECHKRKIVLKQVECGDIGKSTSADWPCYKDCDNVKVRSNINVVLGLTKAGNDTGVLDKWTAYFKDGANTVTGLAGWTTITVCVDAWRTNIVNSAPGTEIRVGTVTVTVKPAV